MGTCTVRNNPGYCSMTFLGSDTVEIRSYNASGTATDFGTGIWFAVY